MGQRNSWQRLGERAGSASEAAAEMKSGAVAWENLQFETAGRGRDKIRSSWYGQVVLGLLVDVIMAVLIKRINIYLCQPSSWLCFQLEAV
jgi:hypothetical protein